MGRAQSRPAVRQGRGGRPGLGGGPDRQVVRRWRWTPRLPLAQLGDLGAYLVLVRRAVQGRRQPAHPGQRTGRLDREVPLPRREIGIPVEDGRRPYLGAALGLAGFPGVEKHPDDAGIGQMPRQFLELGAIERLKLAGRDAQRGEPGGDGGDSLSGLGPNLRKQFGLGEQPGDGRRGPRRRGDHGHELRSPIWPGARAGPSDARRRRPTGFGRQAGAATLSTKDIPTPPAGAERKQKKLWDDGS